MSEGMLQATHLFLSSQLTSQMDIDDLMTFLVRCTCYYVDNSTTQKRLANRLLATGIFVRDDGVSPQALMPGTTTTATTEILTHLAPQGKVTREADELRFRTDPDGQVNNTVKEVELLSNSVSNPNFTELLAFLAPILTNANLNPRNIQAGTSAQMWCYMSGAKVFRLADNPNVVKYLPDIATNNVEHIMPHFLGAIQNALPELSNWNNLDLVEQILMSIIHCAEYRASARLPNLTKADNTFTIGFRSGSTYIEGADFLSIAIFLASMCITSSGDPLFNLSTLADSEVPIDFTITLNGSTVSLNTGQFTTDTLYRIINKASSSQLLKASVDLLKDIAKQGMDDILKTVAMELTTNHGAPGPKTITLVQAMSAFVKRRLPEITATVTNTSTASNIFSGNDNLFKMTALAQIAKILLPEGEKAVTAFKLQQMLKKLKAEDSITPEIAHTITQQIFKIFSAVPNFASMDAFKEGMMVLNKSVLETFKGRALGKLRSVSVKGWTQLFDLTNEPGVFDIPIEVGSAAAATELPAPDILSTMGALEIINIDEVPVSNLIKRLLLSDIDMYQWTETEDGGKRWDGPDSWFLQIGDDEEDGEALVEYLTSPASDIYKKLVPTGTIMPSLSPHIYKVEPPTAYIIIDLTEGNLKLGGVSWTFNGKTYKPGDVIDATTLAALPMGNKLVFEKSAEELITQSVVPIVREGQTYIHQVKVSELPSYFAQKGWSLLQTAGRRRHKTHKRSKRTKRRKTAKRRLLKLK